MRIGNRDGKRSDSNKARQKCELFSSMSIVQSEVTNPQGFNWLNLLVQLSVSRNKFSIERERARKKQEKKSEITSCGTISICWKSPTFVQLQDEKPFETLRSTKHTWLDYTSIGREKEGGAYPHRIRSCGACYWRSSTPPVGLGRRPASARPPAGSLAGAG